MKEAVFLLKSVEKQIYTKLRCTFVTFQQSRRVINTSGAFAGKVLLLHAILQAGKTAIRL
jgi:hypothetical protein